MLRSTDRGANWSRRPAHDHQRDNPGLAVNSRGRVGLLYQQLDRHRRRAALGDAPRADEQRLGDAPRPTSSSRPCPRTRRRRSFHPYIGDYANLVAVGKDFYGIFSANNTPTTPTSRTASPTSGTRTSARRRCSPPTATTWCRRRSTPSSSGSRRSWPTHDFYVRDWTDSATSGDNGARAVDAPGLLPHQRRLEPAARTSPAASTRTTSRQNEYPKMGPANAGRNYGFCRVRRNAGGAAATVTAHFLVSPFGMRQPVPERRHGSGPQPLVRRGRPRQDARRRRLRVAHRPDDDRPPLLRGRDHRAGRPDRPAEPARPHARLADDRPDGAERQQQGAAKHVAAARRAATGDGLRTTRWSGTGPRSGATSCSTTEPTRAC